MLIVRVSRIHACTCACVDADGRAATDDCVLRYYDLMQAVPMMQLDIATGKPTEQGMQYKLHELDDEKFITYVEKTYS